MPPRTSLLETIVVVGTSLAGLRAIEALRGEGYAGHIVAIGDEPHMPYDRPPLSKQFLKGEWEADRLALRWSGPADLDVDWRLGQRARSLDTAAKLVEVEDAEPAKYDGLVIATGSAARSLPGLPDLEGVFRLRTLADGLALRAALARRPRVAIIGAGFIGMEVAASCRELGLEVTVVEALDTPLVRGIGTRLGQRVADVYREQGVDLRMGAGVAKLVGGKRVEALELADGTRIEADAVLVGVGASPATQWLESSGLELDDGVVCDASCATGAPGVVAAGDVARWIDERNGERVRAEHWNNAVEQGAHAARRLLLGPEVGPYRHVPYVWTDQFHLRIQVAGEVRDGDDMHVCHGSLSEERFVALFGRGGQLTGAVGFRRPRQLLDYRDQIAEGTRFEDAVRSAD